MNNWYISHSSGPWKEHLYTSIVKINGVPRYIYDKAGGSAKKKLEEKDKEYRKAEEEYDAAKNMTAQELANRGVSVEDRGKKAESAGKAASEAAQAYNKTALGKAEGAKNKVKSAGEFLKKRLSRSSSGSKSSTSAAATRSVPSQTRSTPETTSNRPKSRSKRKVSGSGNKIYKRGSGLNLGGAVGNGNLRKRYLSHYGIEGMKWGIQNGPPYPLDYGDHSPAEKRAMKKADKKELKAAYKKAEYSTAASNELKRRNARDESLARRRSRSMSDLDAVESNAARNRSIEKAADKQAAKDADDLLKLTERFMAKYGSVPVKDFGIDYTKGGKLDLTEKQEARILNAKTISGLMMGQLIAGPIGALIGGSIGAKKDADRLSEFERSLDKKPDKKDSNSEVAAKTGASNKTLNKLSRADFDGDKYSISELKSFKKEAQKNKDKEYEDLVDQMLSSQSRAKETKMAKAKQDDRYDMAFLEEVQNAPFASSNNAQLQKEYSKYLDDPRKYRYDGKTV